jgi:hypothetical protein
MLRKPISRDEVSTAMTEFRPSSDTPRKESAVRCQSVRDRIFVGLVLYTLIRTGEALAADQAAVTRVAVDPAMGDFGQSPPLPTASIRPPADYARSIDMSKRDFSSTEFRPRKANLLDRDPSVAAFDDTPALHATTVWQRLGDYKSHDRVRVLTLWESQGSTISLQAGRKGDPSLQWTSRWMNRGGSTRGLLDRWFSVSLANAGDKLRGVSRSVGAPAPSKQLNMPVNAGLK